VIVLDEPTSSLGADDADRLYAALDALRARGVSVVYVSHALAEVRRVASSATVLRDGRTAFAGSLDSVTDQQLIAHMAGREVAEASASSRGAVSGVALHVERLSCEPVVREASFELRHGEILGIAGLAGAGRTELLEAIFALRSASGGSITFTHDTARSIAALWKSGVGMVREDRKHGGLSLRQSIACNAALPSVGRIARSGMVSTNALRAHAFGPCQRLGVRMRSLDQPIAELSGGNQQKVAFARLLASGARVLLLDEPTRGIDVGARATIHQLLREASANGAAILVVSSQLPELLQLCDRIAVMRQGVLSAARSAKEWTQESLVAAALHASKGVLDIA
jgi:ribose transport system ATP-binding protein